MDLFGRNSGKICVPYHLYLITPANTNRTAQGCRPSRRIPNPISKGVTHTSCFTRRYSLLVLDTCAPSCTQHLASEMPLTHRFAEAQVGSSGSLTATNSCHSTQLCCSWRSSSAHTHQHKSGKGRPAIFDDVSDVVLLPLYKRYSFGVLR